MASTTTVSKEFGTPNFIDFLYQHGFVTKPVFERLTEFQSTNGGEKKQSVEDFLLAQKILDEEQLTQARAAFFNLPYVDLLKTTVPKQVLEVIPKESIQFYNFVPFELFDGVLKVALSDPTNLQALQALEFLGQKQNLQIQLFLASKTSIDAAVGGKHSVTNVVGEALKDYQDQSIADHPVTQANKETPSQVIEGAPIIKIVDVILTNAIEGGASDIHIEPSETDVRVRYRIDGILHTSLMLPKHVHAAIVSRIKILSNLKIDESRLPQDGRFHMETDRKKVDLRVSILPLIYGEKIVMRILDKTSSVPTLDQLGVRGLNLKWIMESIQKTHGIFLITGPTGSGKSTTLYSILTLKNTPSVNIVTLEDPVEYFIEGVNQSQINPEIGLTFAAGLRSILRQDPNVVMVGEVRDRETAELSVHAALTGHLVFSTLHTNNAIGAMPRLMDMEIEPFLLVASVNMVMAQRLVRKVCPDCKKLDTTTPKNVLAELADAVRGVPKEYTEGYDINKPAIYKGVGCDKCENTGYRGRLGIFEVMPITQQIQELILSKVSGSKILEVATGLGMITMKQDGIIKVLRGETTIEEVVRVTTE